MIFRNKIKNKYLEKMTLNLFQNRDAFFLRSQNFFGRGLRTLVIQKSFKKYEQIMFELNNEETIKYVDN